MKVDFYVLGHVDEHARHNFACRLAEKAWRLKNTIHIHTMSHSDAQRLDQLLWTFRDGSFVPHEIIGAQTGAPVTIGHGTEYAKSCDLLISLCDEVPSFVESFPRVAELVISEEDSRRQGRERFAHYRDQGHTIETHKL